MDITDEQAKLNKSFSVPNHPHPTSSSSDHVIPQMVITSADDTSDEQKNVTECTLVLIPPHNGHSADAGDRSASAEFTDSANSVTEGKPTVDFEDISVVVRDVVSRCTETVSHSVRQRPLVMEVEKNVQSQDLTRDDGSIKCPPPPPPPVPSNVTPPPPSITPPPSSITSPAVSSPPTTMQRPLVFDGVMTKTDSSIEIQKEPTADESSKIKDEPICDIANQEKQFASDIPTEKAKSPEECTTPTKKEGLQGVKKFFDSLLHHETQESVASPEESVTQKESNIPEVLPDASKSRKSSVKKLFSSPQTEISVLPSPPESPRENKESTSFAKDAKQSIKTFFDTFKHESVDPKESSESKIKLDQSAAPKGAESEGYILSSTPESPKDSKQTTSFTKDTKENIKAFFDTFKLDPVDRKSKSSSEKKLTFESDTAQESVNQSPELSEPGSPKELKESSSFAKDTKQNIKAFFDTFKHESSEPKLKSNVNKMSVSQPNIGQEEDNKNFQSFDSKRSKTPTSFAKEEPGSSKELKESSSFTKDTKQNIKTFFDTFKHEPNEPKVKSNVNQMSVSQPNIGQEEYHKNFQSSDSKRPKTPTSFAKDTKQNIKSFFDTFKHEPTDQKPKENTIKLSISQPVISEDKASETHIQSSAPESPTDAKESSSFVKDTKHNIKTFFDTFRPESSDQKHKDTVCKKSHSQPDFSKDCKEAETTLPESSEISKSRESSSFAKEAKQNVKSFFDSFKSESPTPKCEDTQKPIENLPIKETNQEFDHDKNTKSEEIVKESSSFAKDARQNIKTFFDSFKHDTEDVKSKEVSPKKSNLSEPDLYKETESQHKDTKHSLKKLFSTKHTEDADSFKHDAEDVKNKEVSPKKSNLSQPVLYKETDSQHKDTKHSLKKLFSTKHTEDTGETGPLKCPDDSLCKSGKDPSRVKLFKGTKSVKLDLNPQYSTNGAENTDRLSGSVSYINGYDKELISTTKERAQSVPSDREKKKFNIFPEIKKTEDSSVGSFDTPDGKSGENKGIKKFFDSFKQGKSDAGSSLSVESKKESTKDISAMDLAVGIDESKATEKSTKDKKNKSIKRSFSDKVSREEVVQNFKGFFESIGHKSSKKSGKDSEHIYDVVEVKSDVDSSVPVMQISEEGTEVGKKSTRGETHGVKKMLSSLRSKDVSKPGSQNIHVPEKSVLAEENKHIETELEKTSNLTPGVVKDTSVKDISANETEPKSSMFNAIGENIIALKDKVLHTKEKRKSELIDDSVKSPDTSSKVCEMGLDKDEKITPSAVNDKSNKENINKMKPVPPEKPVVKELPKVQSPQVKTNIDDREKPAGPGSLYDTCCMKIAVLLRDKALDIVSERTKSPPPKPPKPSAEAIAKARAAAVSRRIAEAKRMGHSVGENIPYGCDGMRYADDETESSCDYKDVENFDYIMDYDLINRYKLDSSKFDTFSVPSTCSGLTSFYSAADTITLRDDIYSDAVMETISLNSDVSYNFKQSSSSSKNDSKNISPNQKEVKKSKADGKESTIKSPKKVPPPIPPKPLILQNISKIKVKPDDKAVSQCVNGLSLSPRLKNKISKDPAATQKRPLLVADIKGTQFSSLQHPKTKKVPPKPARNFDTVLKNESLKNVCTIPTGTASTTEKSVLKPSSSEDSTVQQSSIESSLQSKAKIEKRTKSPPRPPPPNLTKKPEKPPKPERPPPPVKNSKISISDELSEEIFEKYESNDASKELTSSVNLTDSSPQSTTYENAVVQYQGTNLSDTPALSDECKLEETSVQLSDECKLEETSVQLSYECKLEETSVQLSYEYKQEETSVQLSYECKLEETSVQLSDNKEPVISDHVTDDLKKLDLSIEKDIMNNNIETEKAIADSLNNNVELSEPISIEQPKPPPRNRRIRSRTVEIVPPERSEERLKRSQSLSEIDVQKRVTFLNAEKSRDDSKSLYTVVNKDGKKSNTEKTSRSSPDLVSCRPLPAPPPPPRRFRSLERKSKSKGDSDKKVNENGDDPDLGFKALDTSLERIKPPSRRRKTDKERFFSLRSDQRKEIEESLKRAASVPSKPNRKAKSSRVQHYDVNANISSPLTSEENLNISNQNIPNIEGTESLSKSVLKKDVDSRPRSHSSWYDESEGLEDSWETVDEVSFQDMTDELKHNPLVPKRRKSESKRKNRETSKFYVNMDEEPGASSSDKGVSPLPLVNEGVSPLTFVDKETSPLPLDCSEKSVQTSLETLSHGVVSHDDSEDTDELLDLAQTLQKELSTIINRHKSVNESNDDTPSPPLSAAASEKNLAELKEFKKISSVRSSTSEVWPVTSSDESDVERVGEDSSNVNEIAIKRKNKKIFFIAREIMTSEEAFVDALKLLNVDFKAAVEAANKQKNMSVIPDEVLSQILNHLPQLQHLNENLLMELKDRIENWEKSEKIADIIVKMGPFLKLYSWYIHDFESNVALLEDSKRKYPTFAQVIKEFEMSTRCKRLTLNHYMLKPIQRIPQYRLLLQEYLHHLTEDSKDYQDTVAALQIVSEVANHANDSMKHGDNAQKLISIQNSIMGHKEIVKPGRVFVREGELMKLSRKGMQPRWFVLFNDLLLYLTPVQQGLYRVNHELPLTGMKVAIPIQQDYQNEFSIISVTRSFTLAARSPEERQEWIVALTKAIEENASKRSTFTNSRLLQNAQDKTSSEDEGAFVLGKKAPVWIPDARVTMCQLCTSEFTVTFRRHHCRACGKVVCSICSSHRISLPYLGNRIARVCDECHVHLGQGSSACTESGETDSENQQIAVKPHLRTENRHVKKNKRALPSVLKEVCANDQGSTISGYLHKKTGKSWKRDWFVVKDKVLYEYKASEDIAALRSTPLLGYIIESFTEAYEGVDASLLFQLTHPGQAPIIFYADTVGSAERWVSALKTATVLE